MTTRHGGDDTGSKLEGNGEIASPPEEIIGEGGKGGEGVKR